MKRIIFGLSLFTFLIISDTYADYIRDAQGGCNGLYDYVYVKRSGNKTYIKCRGCNTEPCPTSIVTDPDNGDLREAEDYAWGQINNNVFIGFSIRPSGWSVRWQSDDTYGNNSCIKVWAPGENEPECEQAH